MKERWASRQKLHAIHNKDREAIFRDLGILHRLLAKQETCCICGRTLQVDDVQCLFQQEGKICMCCTEMDCYEQLLIARSCRRT